jgi:hypothetical protein
MGTGSEQTHGFWETGADVFLYQRAEASHVTQPNPSFFTALDAFLLQETSVYW